MPKKEPLKAQHGKTRTKRKVEHHRLRKRPDQVNVNMSERLIRHWNVQYWRMVVMVDLI